jgi:ABC-type multidrug transport system fused ATPase/permease subunit
VERTSLRRLIGIIPQHIELFSGSILENIVPGEVNPDAGKLLKMATFTGLMGFVNRLPEGFYTELGEQGLSLSGGERQRIALTRALYREPEMLILDEATSALDPLSEAEILDLIRKLRASGMTLVIISHKLSLVKDADHIVLVDGGRAAESGRHRDLIRSRGLYSRLWSAQQEPGSMPGQKTL